mgnify:CR=1 FL=1
MEERNYLITLFEYYKSLLTLKQQEYFIDYYFDNLTMEEIAINDNVSKNAVSKQIKIIKDKLNYYENNLKLYRNNINIKKIIKDKEILNSIIEYI